ncbi:MAG: type I secretion system permease/ATPase [Rhodobacteraceae bacterium]|nr:type I secretion system permease/ATPase [Paracoccaceae bacterium]
MRSNQIQIAQKELREARKASRKLYWFVGILSFFANMLMLTGPLYMLQLYDRVLSSRSEATLIALSVLVVFLYGIMGILDYTRGRIMARVAARFQSGLDLRVFDAMIRRSSVGASKSAQTGLSDLESIQRLISSPVMASAFDLPWTPFFLVGIALFHPWLGILALAGGALLIIASLLNQAFSKRPSAEANQAAQRGALMSDQMRNESEMIESMGMRDSAFGRWQTVRNESLQKTMTTGDVTGSFTSMIKSLRLLLQSAMLGLGAYLVLQNELTPGAMIAGSILLGRALAPIELAINQWGLVQRAQLGWANLVELLSEVSPVGEKTQLPPPKARLGIRNLTVVPPGGKTASLKNLSFDVDPGQAIGIIGPSGAGKSTLARALTGMWRPAGGSIRLDGAALDQYTDAVLGEHIGYLPQRVQLFDGTITENIARLDLQPDAERVVKAAQRAAAHEMILQLPDGYDTRIVASNSRLSGGQMQRIGLARALYSNPVILILDEPNSNLDNVGSMALNQAIRQFKADDRAVLIMAHRPAAIQECDILLVLESGMRAAFGSKEDVLKETVQNHATLQKNTLMGGVT